MKSIYLFTSRTGRLEVWDRELRAEGLSASLTHCPVLASAEQQQGFEPNELVVENGEHSLVLLDRSTILEEYDDTEVARLQELLNPFGQSFAIDYKDRFLLKRVLELLLNAEGPGHLVVQAQRGEFRRLTEASVALVLE